MVAEHHGFYRYWGKAGSVSDEAGYHLLPYHCLDVAAVGAVLLRQQQELVLGLAGFLGAHADDLRAWLTYLLAIHDVGKFANGFQNLRPDIMLVLQGRQVAANYQERHDTVGYRFCAGKSRQGAVVELLAPLASSAIDPEDLRSLLDPWLSAVTGHHGRPPVLTAFPRPLAHDFPVAVAGDATAFLRETLGCSSRKACPSSCLTIRKLGRSNVSPGSQPGWQWPPTGSVPIRPGFLIAQTRCPSLTTGPVGRCAKPRRP